MASQRIELPLYSMFAKTPVYEVGGNVVFGLKEPAVVPHGSDILYTVPAAAEFRLDLLSTQFYGVPDLWWVIASVNNLIDPLVGIAPGTRIRVPTQQRLASEGVLNV